MDELSTALFRDKRFQPILERSRAMNMNPILAAVSPELTRAVPPILASLLMGLAVVSLVRTITQALYSEDLSQDDEWRYDVNRINELRKQSVLYRWFYPLIQVLGRFNRGAFPEELPEMAREIQAAGFSRFWTPEEYLARIELIALFLLPFYSYVCIEIMGGAGLLLGIVLTGTTAYLLRRRLRNQAHHRLVLIKRRLPFMLDLVTLLMEAGATFMNALREAVDEFRDHPVGVEFGRMLGEMNMGKGRTTALESLKQRLSDDEITGIVGSIIQGENLGTPLSKIFRTQSDVLRLKRSQRAELISGQAAVQMLLPGVLIMASTVIIILGPFVINFFYTEFV